MEELHKKITETVPIFFFVYHLKKKEIQFISPQFYELAEGIEAEGDDPLQKCVHPDYHETMLNFFDDLSPENAYEGSVELKANEKLRGIKWLELNTFPVKEKEAEVLQLVGHIVNITEKKLMYDTLREEKEHISNMMNMLIHDLRAPFNRIHMIVELLENSMTAEEYEKHKSYLSLLRKQGEDSVLLIQSLLRLATLKGEASSLDIDIHDLRDLVKDSLKEFQQKIEKRELQVYCEFPNESVKAKLDPVLFRQVLHNLLSNALKYTPKRGKIGFYLSYEKGNVQLVIKDSGVGIPAKYQKDLFQSFQGYRRKGLEGEQSVGLGLFICKEIISMHRGIIQVESREGEGTAFTITLPFPESSAAYY